MRRDERQVLLELELTSTARAASLLPVVSGSTPSSAPPSGDDTPARYWAQRFGLAVSDSERQRLVREARAELRAIRRRVLPRVAYETADELALRVVDDGEGFDTQRVALALCCTPTFVRRARLAHGREPEYGRVVELDALEPRTLLDAGFSVRQAAAVLGVPRSTLHEHVARAA
jgi:hypothetical protein